MGYRARQFGLVEIHRGQIALTAMRWHRMVISMLGATVLVLGLLAVSLRYYDRPGEAGADGVRGFEIDYLTAEEAAALLGEPERYRAPERVSLPLMTPADDEPAL